MHLIRRSLLIPQNLHGSQKVTSLVGSIKYQAIQKKWSQDLRSSSFARQLRPSLRLFWISKITWWMAVSLDRYLDKELLTGKHKMLWEVLKRFLKETLLSSVYNTFLSFAKHSTTVKKSTSLGQRSIFMWHHSHLRKFSMLALQWVLLITYPLFLYQASLILHLPLQTRSFIQDVSMPTSKTGMGSKHLMQNLCQSSTKTWPRKVPQKSNSLMTKFKQSKKLF